MFTRTLAPPGSTTRRLLLATSLILLFLAAGAEAWAHNVAEGDKGYIQESSGVLFWPFVYLGAKHMVTGDDHLLFLFGVIFFLYRMKDIGLYVTRSEEHTSELQSLMSISYSVFGLKK